VDRAPGQMVAAELKAKATEGVFDGIDPT
jgi:hypothetical protein